MLTRGVQRAVAVIAVLITASGCQITDAVHEHFRESHCELLRTAEVRGQFAVPGTLAIPDEGLSLGQAVAQQLRPAIREFSGPSMPVVVSEPTRSLEHTPLPPSDSTLSMLSHLAASLDTLESSQSLEPLLKQLANQRIDGVDVAPDAAQQLRARVAALLLLRIDAVKGGDEEDIIRLAREVDELIRTATGGTSAPTDAAVPTSAGPSGAGSADATTRSAGATTAAEAGLYYDAVVVLTRRSGRRIVAPLWLVEGFAAGDIQLHHGDRVEVVHFGSTAVGSRQYWSGSVKDGTSQSVIVTGLTTSAGRRELTNSSFESMLNGAGIPVQAEKMADVAILQRLTRNGQFEQYLIPVAHSGAYGKLPDYSPWLQQINLSQGDIVAIDNLNLTDVVRAGQSQAISASASLLNSDGPVHAAIKDHFRRADAAAARQMRLTTGLTPQSVDALHRQLQIRPNEFN